MELEGSPIAKTSFYVYLGRSMNMENDLKEEVNWRRRAAWAAFGPVLYLCYAAETWPDTVAMSKALRTTTERWYDVF
ncbi:unnamed protein product [Strongylus vulgaris]|uniref:Mitochondrial fission process protein 1 n=1 Tax=Strongylus vulgaris TaxID=40348 RepID=A0A3P7J8Y8_STRVU|nr:unnamed protein product [Strongylus vulgaris]